MALAASLAASGAGAQRVEEEVPPTIGFSFTVGNAIGELGTYFDQGFGGQVHGVFPLHDRGIVRLRGDLGFLIYGVERQRHCFPGPVGCRLNLEVNTTNSIGYGGVGPEFALPVGAIEPYVYGTFGFAAFWTSSSLEEGYDRQDYFNTTHLSDGMVAWRTGGGVRVRVWRGGKGPILLNFGVERHHNGVARFLTKGDIIDHPDGSITIRPNRSRANLMTFRVGVSFGLRRGR